MTSRSAHVLVSEGGLGALTCLSVSGRGVAYWTGCGGFLAALGISADEIRGRVVRVTFEVADRALPEGWEVRPGLGDRVWLRVPRRQWRGARERARREGVRVGSVHDTADGRYAAEVRLEDVPRLAPDRRGEARHLAADEGEAGCDPRGYRRRVK